MEKKDNMGQKSSGAGTIKFDYFFEMDEIFSQDPNVQPVSTASSSRRIQYASFNMLNQLKLKKIHPVTMKKLQKRKMKSPRKEKEVN